MLAIGSTSLFDMPSYRKGHTVYLDQLELDFRPKRKVVFLSTPIESYAINGKEIYVKREDLCCRDSPNMPPLAKLRGASILLEKLKAQGVEILGNQDTRVSMSGLGVAALCKELSMSCILGYPDGREGAPVHLQKAQELGAELYPLRPNYIRILYAQTKKYVEGKKGYMLPFGLVCAESVLAVAEEASTVPDELLTGTLVICVGTGTMLTGVLLGLRRLPVVVGISSGMSLANQERNIRRLLFEANVSQARLSEINDKLRLLPAIMPYSEECEFEVPFPTHKNYDAKAWLWLCQHVDELEPPVLFWNIGAGC